ncbi:MAG: hypothetical protein WAK17_05675 [Candidatus Nitrosopolaris sp.]
MDAMRILPSVKHALTSSHSIFNYSNFLAFLTEDFLPSRELLILDEAHLLETEIVGFTGISISNYSQYLHCKISLRIILILNCILWK